MVKERKNAQAGLYSGIFTRSRLYPPLVFALQAALGFSIVSLLLEGEVAKAVIVVVFLVLSLAYLLREDRWPTLFDLLFALAALSGAVGYVFGLFESVAYYDKVTHAFMTFSVSLAFFFVFYAGAVPRRRAISLATSVFTLGLTVGAIWEIFEWGTGVGGGGLSDTITDLIVDGVGALMAVGVALAARERGERLT
ncbi:MAG: hypothetical protein M3305_08970 [Actinomycetota bacterium]|nr:hypothetical protein [Actinomycetota bacterium]